ncbi:MAG: N-acetylmuramoyl-L-alanine amidase [Chloroflexi bacterium]|nr:N-acetylmuramoyl-L-alanine amidase [Chloroflexota bacterium]
MKTYSTILLGIILGLSTVACIDVEIRSPETKTAEGTLTAEWRQSTAADFESGTRSGLEVRVEGDGELVLAGGERGDYTSTVKKADGVFNAFAVRRNARLLNGTSVEFEVRTSENGRDWSNWVDVHAEADVQAKQTKDDALSQVVAVGKAQYLQYRAILLSTGADSPVLEDVTVTLLNSESGPNLAQAKNVTLPKAAGQPTIISRQGWGANERLRYDAKGKEIWPAEFKKPTKIIIHHTLTRNDDPNPVASVRAVYHYHAATLGWGDVGYNYLVDPQGNLYEGRRGDGVVGGHSYGHNEGTIGIAVLGNYLTTDVSEPAAKALVELLTFLADKYGIDPGGSSVYIDHNLPNISGHKDANKTSCPGTYLYDRIPDLRKRVLDKLPAPVVAIDSPDDGAPVWQTVKIRASAGAASSSVSKMDFYVNDKLATTLNKAPWEWPWNISGLPEGQYTIKVVAQSSLGKTTSATRAVNVRKPPVITWYFAEGNAGPTFQTWLLLMNPNATPARVYASFYDEGGKVERREFAVQPRRRTSIYLSQILKGAAVAMKIESDGVIFAERSMFFGHDGHSTAGTTTLSKTWYFAEGSTEPAFEEWLLVFNPNEARANVIVTYFKPDGSTVSKSYVASPQARLNIWANKDVPGTALAAKVEADVPIVAERSMYSDSGKSGHNSMGAPNLSQTWYFAEGATGSNFDTWILVANPNPEPTEVKATLLRESAPPELRTYVMPPRTRLNIWLNREVGPGAVATKIEATRPIVAERSVYLKDTAATHNALGAPAPAREWYLPEGATAGGFVDWILVMNPGAAPANLSVAYLTEKGEALIKPYQVAPNSRLNILVNADVPNEAVSAVVKSDQPVVVERSTYFKENAGATNSMGIAR